jgi:type IV pilus assembly protein PilE
MKKSGFTLVELLIALAIISILAVIAIPAYNDYVEEARLTSAKSSALSIKPYLEEYHLETGSYFDSSTDTYNGENVDFTWSASPHTSGYKITITAEKDYSFSRDMELLN